MLPAACIVRFVRTRWASAQRATGTRVPSVRSVYFCLDPPISDGYDVETRWASALRSTGTAVLSVRTVYFCSTCRQLTGAWCRVDGGCPTQDEHTVRTSTRLL
ncbi:hypothetical protein PBRA_007765 [Plasmodiophora brassicae]|uniref:Uncharacterized protein n=1 Tax=Plasmodiophora brassicae TaxID=37360 RepID=A0A0G4IY88_PLABS|nr:hypothetical protein PBRA_007765 [Plasmodiophora brassicae]